MARNRECDYGFHGDASSTYSTGKGLTEEIVHNISKVRGEPDRMLEYRLKSLELFHKLPMSNWDPDLSGVDSGDVTYFQKLSNRRTNNWDDASDKIRQAFERLGIPEAERQFLLSTVAQYESEAVYHNMKDEFKEQGIIFTDTGTALQEYPNLFKKYFGKIVPNSERKFATLNGAVWSGGTFIYVPKGMQCGISVQTYFRISGENAEQFERSLIIIDEGTSIQYVEGCTTPNYTTNSLHVATVETIVKRDTSFHYTTIRNWSGNVYNLVAGRGTVEEGDMLEWVDGDFGSKANMKYLYSILSGPHARTSVLSMAFADYGQHLDTSCKVYHNTPHTSSTLISKSVVKDGGKIDYRDSACFGKDSGGSKSHIECGTILINDLSSSGTVPFNEIHNSDVTLERKVRVSKVSEDQLCYMMGRGVSKEEVTAIVVNGSTEPITKELPTEYTVELNSLITMSMESSVSQSSKMP